MNKKKDKPRYSLEEMITLDINRLNEIGRKQHKEWCKKFESS